MFCLEQKWPRWASTVKCIIMVSNGGGGGGGGGNPGVRGQKVGENFQKSGSFLVKCEVISVVWGGRQDVGTPLSPPPPSNSEGRTWGRACRCWHLPSCQSRGG